jgi:hypothetical protein
MAEKKQKSGEALKPQGSPEGAAQEEEQGQEEGTQDEEGQEEGVPPKGQNQGQPSLRAQLQEHGVTDKARVAMVDSLVAAGMDRGKILSWIVTNGPTVLDVIKSVIDLFGGERQLAAVKGFKGAKEGDK